MPSRDCPSVLQGIPLHIQIDTYDVDDQRCRRIHRAICKIKVFCEKVTLPLSARICLFVPRWQPANTRSSAIAEGPRDASCQLKSSQLPRNSAETTCTTCTEQIEVMKLEGYSGSMCNKHVHSTMTRSSRFHCLICVIKTDHGRVVDITCIPTTCCGEIF